MIHQRFCKKVIVFTTSGHSLFTPPLLVI